MDMTEAAGRGGARCKNSVARASRCSAALLDTTTWRTSDSPALTTCRDAAAPRARASDVRARRTLRLCAH